MVFCLPWVGFAITLRGFCFLFARCCDLLRLVVIVIAVYCVFCGVLTFEVCVWDFWWICVLGGSLGLVVLLLVVVRLCLELCCLIGWICCLLYVFCG